MPTLSAEHAALRPFLARLASYVKLSDEELILLARSVSSSRRLSPHSEVLAQGRQSNSVFVVLRGFACRFKVLSNGRRQITSYLVPGDICDYRFLANRPADQGTTTLSPTTIGAIPLEAMASICERFPHITNALLSASAVDEAIGREWMINLGQRTAVQRTAQVICELYVRLYTVGLTDRLSFNLPITQSELGEALGLSTVHVNRTLQELRRADLITLKSGVVTILDVDRLASLAMFDPQYLGVPAMPNPEKVTMRDLH